MTGKQLNLYENWKKQSRKISELSSLIQNDFDFMIEQKISTKEEMKKVFLDWKSESKEDITKLIEFRKNIIQFMNEYLDIDDKDI